METYCTLHEAPPRSLSASGKAKAVLWVYIMWKGKCS